MSRAMSTPSTRAPSVAVPAPDWIPLQTAPFFFFPDFLSPPGLNQNLETGRLVLIDDRIDGPLVSEHLDAPYCQTVRRALKLNFAPYTTSFRTPDTVIVHRALQNGGRLHLQINIQQGVVLLMERHEAGWRQPFMEALPPLTPPNFIVRATELLRCIPVTDPLPELVCWFQVFWSDQCAHLDRAVATGAAEIYACEGSTTAPLTKVQPHRWISMRETIDRTSAVAPDDHRIFSIFVRPLPTVRPGLKSQTLTWLRTRFGRPRASRASVHAEAQSFLPGLSPKLFDECWGIVIKDFPDWRKGGRILSEKQT